jgi:hypothetical protein
MIERYRGLLFFNRPKRESIADNELRSVALFSNFPTAKTIQRKDHHEEGITVGAASLDRKG